MHTNRFKLLKSISKRTNAFLIYINYTESELCRYKSLLGYLVFKV